MEEIKYNRTNQDRLQDAVMVLGGLAILAFWVFLVAQSMKHIAGI